MTTVNQLFERDGKVSERIGIALKDDAVVEPAGAGGEALSTKALVLLRLMPGQIESHLDALLGIGLSDVLAGAWNKAKEIDDEIAKSASTPGEDTFVHLGKHTISSTQRPYLELVAAGREVGRLPFSVVLELSIGLAVLRIRDGAIQEIQSAQIRAKGTVKCGGAVLLERASKKIDLPGSLPVASRR